MMKFWMVLLGSALVALSAKADTIPLADYPTSVVTIKEAMKSKTGSFECEKKQAGTKRARPATVKGSKIVYTLQEPKGIDNAGELMADGKPVVFCTHKTLDNSTGKMIRD